MVKLTAQQRQLFLTAMDISANPHERDVAAAFFFRQLREQFRDSYSLLAELEGSHDSKSSYAVVTMPFGKHRGKKLAEIPPDYLLWLLDNADHLDRYLRSAIERYLQDVQYAN